MVLHRETTTGTEFATWQKYCNGGVLAAVERDITNMALETVTHLLDRWVFSSRSIIESHTLTDLRAGYFLLGDSLNTTVTVIATLQNEIVEYDVLTLTYVLLVGIAAQAIGIWVFWWAQRRFRLGTTTMLNAVIVGILLLDGWGMIGIWTQSFGFHKKPEVWCYQGMFMTSAFPLSTICRANTGPHEPWHWTSYCYLSLLPSCGYEQADRLFITVFYGLFVCPWYSYSQIMISEVTPRGKEFLFFSLFSIIGKTSSFIGPLVSSAIIDRSDNNSSPFYFLFALTLASGALLVTCLDLEKSRLEQEAFLEREQRMRERLKDKMAE